VLILLGVIAAAAVAVGIAIAVSGGSGSSTPAAVSTASTPTTSSTTAGETAASIFAGVPQHGSLLGKASAPARLLVFEDPQCPYCQQWSLGALPTVVEQFVRTGRVALDWRGVQIIGPNSETGLRAAYAAGRQNRLWNMVDELYRLQRQENSGWITHRAIEQAAAAAGVKPGVVIAALDTHAVTTELSKAAADFAAIGGHATPTFILEQGVQQPKQLSASLDGPGFAAALSSALG
jgi:protein-disulfide isomerase